MVGAYLNMVVVSLVCKLCLGFFVLSALKKHLGPVNFFVFVMQNPVMTFPMLKVSSPGYWGKGPRHYGVMGCQIGGANLLQANLYTD